MSAVEIKVRSNVSRKGRDMDGQAGMQRRRDLALQSVYAALAPHLRNSSVDRSRVETALESTQFSADLRHALRLSLDAALREARISVCEDVAGLDRWPGLASAVKTNRRDSHSQASDPLDIGRLLLAVDRGRSPKRRAKVILTAEQEVGLTLLARPGGAALPAGGFAHLSGEARDAADAMVLHNVGLAHSVSRRYVSQGLEYDDLVQHALCGLMRAVEMFDPMSGNKFSTYATWWVRQAVTRAIADEGRLIRLPVYLWELVRKVIATRTRLAAGGGWPSRAKLAAECGITIEKVDECLRLAPGALSLDTPLGEDGFSLGDLVAAQEDMAEHIEVNGMFLDEATLLLDGLDDRSAEVMRMRFGLAPYDAAHTLDEIGKTFGVTRERIRQIESKAFARLRADLGRRGHRSPAILLPGSSAKAPPSRQAEGEGVPVKAGAEGSDRGSSATSRAGTSCMQPV